jgi:type IV secretion system protein TrbF
MTKEFLSEPTSYKPDRHPVTPFMRAQQEWDDRIGSTVVQTKNWRLAFFFSAALTLILSAGLIQQSARNKVIPVFVGVDKERGEPVFLGKAAELPYEPNLQEIKYFISHFVSLVRSVPSDPVLIKQNWLKAYAFLRHDAANILNDITNKDKDSPLKKIGDLTVIVQPVSVVQVAGSSSYQARWEETVYNRHGAPVEKYVMNGVFTIELETPTDEKSLSQNPLGLFITHFQWNREL